ncbi:MAG TPA: AAA family ATPase [Acidimicrobiales bacterium]|nr:AAA family ATPase [Acidimicrobiales bacterium]
MGQEEAYELMNVEQLRDGRVLPVSVADVGVAREVSRRRRLEKIVLVGLVIGAWLWGSVVVGHLIGKPHLTRTETQLLPLVGIVILVGLVMVVPFIAAGRSPHIRYRPEELDVTLDDVKGIPVVVDEAVRTLNLFLAHATFREEMGGRPRRGILFEGPPGTGKTHLAKALAREAGVPFYFVSSSAFQSMFYGQTNRKIRAFFSTLREAARREGGAIGFIEEIDAIGATRQGMGPGGGREGISGVVNELLIQLQSFDQPPLRVRWFSGMIELVNAFLPPARALRKPVMPAANILVIGATNRASDLDPALLRPGRFDRTLTFDLPSRAGRKEILDHELARRSHESQVEERTDQLAASTFGYSPAMLVHLLDEALVWALRRGAPEMSWNDVQAAKMTEELGLAQPVEYTEAERRAIATHEAGHATVAWLVGKSRKLEVLSIIKRSAALGLLAHSDLEERFTQTESELRSLVQISLGGLVAEQLFFGERSSGVAGDLKYATTLAATMVGSMGMGDTLVSYEAVQAGMTNLPGKVLSTDEGRAAVAADLEGARGEVTKLLENNRHIVEALRDALLEHDELVGDRIIEVIQGAVRQPA